MKYEGWLLFVFGMLCPEKWANFIVGSKSSSPPPRICAVKPLAVEAQHHVATEMFPVMSKEL